MSMNWGIPGTIALEDPIYHVFLNIGAHGGANFYVKHTAKFLEKLVGFRDQFNPAELTDPDHGMFRSVINKWVTSDLAKIMISGNVSYFTIAENLFEISEVLRDQLNGVFDEYGIALKEFVIEGVTTKQEDYAEVKEAKSQYMSRKLQGYTWQDEANRDILMTFAGNQGVAGGIGGAMGGFMVGGAMGGTIADLARSVLNRGTGSGSESGPSINGGSGMNVSDFLTNFKSQNGNQQINAQQNNVQQNNAQQSNMQQDNTQQFDERQLNSTQYQQNPTTFGNPTGGGLNPFSGVGAPIQMDQAPVQGMQPMETEGCVCSNCGAVHKKVMKFCSKCGNPIVQSKPKRFCPECGTEMDPDGIFCGNCGHKFEE